MSNEKILDIVEQKRAELNTIVRMHGLSSPITIKYSQELDTLLNRYNDHALQNRSLSTK